MKRILWISMLSLLLLVLCSGVAFADDSSKLPAPTNVRWITSPEKVGWEDVTPGYIYWEDGDSTCERYALIIYSKSGEVVYKTTWHVEAEESVFCVDNLLITNLESGTYRFSIQAVDEKDPSRNSEVVYSDEWSYTKPSAKMPTPKNLRLAGTVLSWDKEEGDYGIELETYYSETESGEYINAGQSWSRYTTNQEDVSYNIGERGYYRFRIRLLSNDITKAVNGSWSEYVYFCYKGGEKKTYTMSDKNSNTVDLVYDEGLHTLDIAEDSSEHGPLMVASYDEEGRFLGIDTLAPHKTAGIDVDAALAEVMWIDGGFRPKSEALEIVVAE